MYLMDANVLIRANGDYYPIDRVPPFWRWLFEKAEAGEVKMPVEIYEEVCKSPDLLGQWLRDANVRRSLVLDEATDLDAVRRVIRLGYAPDLDDVELLTLTRDPFLVAAALMATGRIVATREVSKITQTRARRKVPDVCGTMGIECINDFELWRRLDFRLQ